MRIIGLTGGIASGKSTVARFFFELGAVVHSADVDARTVLSPGSPTLQEVRQAFPDCFLPDGSLDRSALAHRIFNDAHDRDTLNAIMHPAIFARMQETIETARSAGSGILIYEVPLLFENRREWMFDKIIATLVSPEVQAQRLQEREASANRPPLTEEAIKDRLSAQLPVSEKARRADFIIRTDVPMEATKSEVQGLWSKLNAPLT